MKRKKMALGMLFLVFIVATPALAAPQDFVSLRKAADTLAQASQPGAKLSRINVTASYESGALAIHETVFYYIYEQPQGFNGMAVHVLPLEGMQLPKVEQRAWQPKYVEKWQMTPVPGNLLAPEEALRRLNRTLPADPYRSPTGLLKPGRYHGLFDFRLIQADVSLGDSSRNHFQWTVLAEAMGMKSGHVTHFFSRTAPPGRWVWWTVVEQGRPYPGADPRQAGTPRRVQEYIYIDAVTGAVTSHCTGPRGFVPCEMGPQPPTKPGSVLMVSGEVKSMSAQQLVIVTDRNKSVSLREGTEMTFDLTQPHLQNLNLQKGDLVTIGYEDQSGRMTVHTINLRPSEGLRQKE
jgi:hypothetical protein